VKDTDLAVVTLEQAVQWLADKASKGGGKKAAFGKKAAKPAAGKKAARKSKKTPQEGTDS